MDGARGRIAWAVLGLGLSGYALLGVIFGKDDGSNPTAHVFYILLWIGLVPISLVLGPVWSRLNPLRTLTRLVYRLGRLPESGLLKLPAGVGYWPAALGLAGFTWLELIAPNNAALSTLRLAGLLYVSANLIAGLIFGPSWFNTCDSFEVWSRLTGRLAPIGRTAGTLRWQLPLTGLARLPLAPGLLATMVVLLGSTAYDSGSNAPIWFVFVQSSPWPPILVQTLGFLGIMAIIWGFFALGIWLSARISGCDRRRMSAEFAASLFPIALGYIIAHYWTLLVLEGQRAVILLSDPLGTGANWLGFSNFQPQPFLTNPEQVAAIQVLAVVTGHICGVILAHDRSLELFTRRAHLGQLPLLILMVIYTCGGLALLFAS